MIITLRVEGSDTPLEIDLPEDMVAKGKILAREEGMSFEQYLIKGLKTQIVKYRRYLKEGRRPPWIKIGVSH